MIENLFLIIAAIIIIIFIWLFWLRNSLMRDLIAVTQIQSILKSDFAKRRDIIPYLLESYKAASEPTDLWRKLLDLRSRTDSSEIEILETLQGFFASSQSIKNINFHEAKKNISDLNKHIEASNIEIKAKSEIYSALRKRFPYSLASAIFSLPELS